MPRLSKKSITSVVTMFLCAPQSEASLVPTWHAASLYSWDRKGTFNLNLRAQSCSIFSHQSKRCWAKKFLSPESLALCTQLWWRSKRKHKRNSWKLQSWLNSLVFPQAMHFSFMPVLHAHLHGTCPCHFLLLLCLTKFRGKKNHKENYLTHKT